MREPEEKTGKKSVKRRVVFVFLLLIIVILILLAGLYFFGKNIRTTEEEYPEALSVKSEPANEQAISDDSDDPENIIGESDEDSESGELEFSENQTAMASENYKISQVKFGGDVVFPNKNPENIPLEIYDTRSETVTSRDGEEFKLMIVWRTNKSAISEIEYSKSSGQDPMAAKREGYGFNHGVILSDLEPATAYIYRIKAKDRWGNEIVSNYFGAYTGKKAESVFELVVKAAEEVFGWAMKK